VAQEEVVEDSMEISVHAEDSGLLEGGASGSQEEAEAAPGMYLGREGKRRVERERRGDGGGRKWVAL
jgi:hypothetical protein